MFTRERVEDNPFHLEPSVFQVSVKIVTGAGGEVVGAEGFDFPGFHVDHAVLELESAEDAEEGLLDDDETEFFKKLRVDDDVCDAGFVFEADEDDPFGRARSLTADHGAGDGERLIVLEKTEVGGTFEMFREARAENGHRMAPGRDTGEDVIRMDPLVVGHGRER